MAQNYTDSGFVDRFTDLTFPAKLTAVEEDADGYFRYSWTRQTQNPTTGAYEDCDPPQSGDPDDGWAFEDNNTEVDVASEPVVRMYFRGMYGGQYVWGFSAGVTSASACRYEIVATGACMVSDTAGSTPSSGGSGTLGPNSPSSADTIDNGTSIDWTNPDNALANDGSNATTSLAATESSDYLWLTGFGFSGLVGSDTIDGIEVEVEVASTPGSPSPAATLEGRLVYSGAFVPSADTKTSNTAFGVGYTTLGGSTDPWGISWPEAWIMSSSFGIALRVYTNGDAADFTIDHVRITIYYTSAGVIGGSGDPSTTQILRVQYSLKDRAACTIDQTWCVDDPQDCCDDQDGIDLGCGCRGETLPAKMWLVIGSSNHPVLNNIGYICTPGNSGSPNLEGLTECFLWGNEEASYVPGQYVHMADILLADDQNVTDQYRYWFVNLTLVGDTWSDPGTSPNGTAYLGYGLSLQQDFATYPNCVGPILAEWNDVEVYDSNLDVTYTFDRILIIRGDI